MSLDVLDEVPEDQDFPEPDLMNLHDDSSIGPEAVLDLAQAEHSGTAQRPEDLEKIEFEEDQVQISLFSQQSPIAAALTHQKDRSEEHTSELHSLMRTSYAVFCLNKYKHAH